MHYWLALILSFSVCFKAYAQTTEINHPKQGQYIGSVIEFQWNKNLNADSYKLMIGKDINHSDTLFELSHNKHQYQPNSSSIYYWKVIAYNNLNPIDSSSLGSFFYFNPNSLDSLNLWLRSDSALGLNAGKVNTWMDLSDSALQISQTISSRQPQLIPEALNGYPAVRFDSTDDEFFTPLSLMGPNYSISAVYNVREKKNRGIRLFDGSNNWLMGPHVSAYRTFNSVFSAGKLIEQYKHVVHTVQVLNDTLHNLVNGVKYDSKVEAYPPGTSLTISQNGLNGDLFEVIIVNGLLSDSSRLIIDNYLMDKYAPPINLGEDRLVCSFPDSIETNVDYALNFNWSTGDSTAKTLVDSAGTYYLTITDQFGRVSTDSVLIIQDTVNYQLDFGFNDTTLCKGDQFNLIAGEDRYSYQWNTGDTTALISLDSAGFYFLDLINCKSITSRDSFNLFFNEPIFSLGPDTTICFNESYSLQTDSTFMNVSYRWSNGNTSSTITVDSSLSYSLLVTDSYGCFYSDTVVIVIDSSLFGLSLGPDTSLCEGNLLSLNGDTSNIQTYRWGSGNTNSYEQIDTAGIYTLTVSNNLCSFSDTLLLSIQGLAPLANFGSQYFCFGDRVSFTDSSTAAMGDTILTYHWDFGGSSNSASQHPYYSFPDTGLHQVILSVTTDKGCTGSTSKMVDIQSLPQPSFTTVGNCSKRPLQFNSSSSIDEGTIVAYQWDFDNGFTSNLENPIHSFDTLGVYSVKLLATSNQGCVDSIQQTITIDPSPIPNFSFFNQCLGDSTHLISTSQIADGFISEYVWFTNNQQIIDSMAVIKFLNQGEQQVILRVLSDKNCQSILRDTIDIYESPQADFIIEDRCKGEDFIITDNSTSNDPIISYYYTLTKGVLLDTSTAMNPVFQSGDLGVYSIEQRIETINNCTDSVSKKVTVSPLPLADFRILNNGSGAPYTLEVENNSKNAETYIWNSGTGQSSVLSEPSFTYNDTGSYQLELIAKTSFACADTIQKEVRVLPFFLDASIEDAQLIKDLNGSYKMRLRLANSGSNKIENIEIHIESENSFNLAEKIVAGIYKGNSLIYTLNTFLPATNKSSFICFSIFEVNGVKDSREDNNQICVSAFPNKLYFSAYPNPVQEWLKVDLVILSAGKLSLKLFDTAGNEVNNAVDEEFLDEGYHQKNINMEALKSGLYILRYSFEGVKDEIKIVKQ